MLGERTQPRLPERVRRERAWVSVPALLRGHLPLVWACAAVLLIGLPTLNFVYGPDQALFEYIGRGIARGERLYVDLWDVKPPGIFWVYAAVSWLPAGFRGLRAFDLAFTLVAMGAVYALGAWWWERGAAAIGAFLYGLIYVTTTGYWNMAQPDSFMVLPVVLGVLAWEWRGDGNGRRGAVLSGLLFGLAFQFRTVVALLPAVLVLWNLWRTREPAAVIRGLLAVAGFALFQALTLLYLALNGAVGEYLFAQFRFARHYAALGGPYAYDRFDSSSYLSGLRGSLMWFNGSRLFMMAPALAAILWGGVLRGDRAIRLCSWLMLAAVAGVAIQAKFFIYHWQTATPFLALLAGWTARETWRELRRRFALPAATGLFAAAAGVLLTFTPQITDAGIGQWRDIIRYATEPSYRHTYYDRFGLRGHGSYSYEASVEVSGYIRERTQPGDTVFVWGYDPNMYLETGRVSA